MQITVSRDLPPRNCPLQGNIALRVNNTSVQGFLNSDRDFCRNKTQIYRHNEYAAVTVLRGQREERIVTMMEANRKANFRCLF